MKLPLNVRRTRRLVSGVSPIFFLTLATLPACGTHRAAVPSAELAQRAQTSRTQWQERLYGDSAALVERMYAKYTDYAAGRGPEPILDVLALSGGGDYGAFGAGFLVGWARSTDPEFRRPHFDAVSGVSTGALIAPFAFLDSEESYAQIEDLYRHPREDWVGLRDWLFFLPGRSSFMTVDGLRRNVHNVVDEAMVKRLAEENAQGRLLVISATNLDLGDQVVWNLGDEAQERPLPEARERVVDMMMASAAIPAVFPPVEIDHYLFGDGGVTANVLLRLERANPAGFFVQWYTKHPEAPFPRTRFWVILNNQRTAPPQTAQPDWTDIAGRAIATAIRSATIAQVELLVAKADDLNARNNTRIEVYMTAIPPDWVAPVAGTFKAETMQSLADLGRARGADPASWRLLTEPRDAPAK
jgi:predicted acylesterase/phospholipase RssA